DDAEFKGYQNVVVQEIKIITDNVKYIKEIYHSRSQNKTYMRETPSEIEREFGPGVKSTVLMLKHVVNASESKIHEFMTNFGIHIAPSTISHILTKNKELFHREKADIFRAGLTSTGYQQMDDAEFKGYQNVVVQEIKIITDNVKYIKEIYHSRSQNKTYMRETPSEIEREFGPGVKSTVLMLKHVVNASESKIHEFMTNFGIHIAPSTISHILTKNKELFHREKADIFRAGLTSTGYQQMDDTSSNVHSQNHYALNRLQPLLHRLFYNSAKGSSDRS
ncbi:MAG: hypothetical protein U9N36_02680, partial [Euryarchaeota archaeon]|nr:hypothetical protein [Euryarchaeota archaeon]